MKAKKILFLLAGIANCVMGGFGVLLGGLVLILNRVLRLSFEASFDFVENYIKELVSQDSEYEYLLDVSKEEAIDFVIKSCNMLAVAMFLLGAVVVVFGIINLLLSSQKHYAKFKQKKIWKVLLITSSWVIMCINVVNILTTIACCLKDKDDTPPLYSINEGVGHA